MTSTPAVTTLRHFARSGTQTYTFHPAAVEIAILDRRGKVLEIRRLSPLAEASVIPSRCKIVSILERSPAQKAGLHVGDQIISINGSVPADAAAVAELVTKAGSDMDVELARDGGKSEHLK